MSKKNARVSGTSYSKEELLQHNIIMKKHIEALKIEREVLRENNKELTKQKHRLEHELSSTHTKRKVMEDRLKIAETKLAKTEVNLNVYMTRVDVLQEELIESTRLKHSPFQKDELDPSSYNMTHITNQDGSSDQYDPVTSLHGKLKTVLTEADKYPSQQYYAQKTSYSTYPQHTRNNFSIEAPMPRIDNRGYAESTKPGPVYARCNAVSSAHNNYFYKQEVRDPRV